MDCSVFFVFCVHGGTLCMFFLQALFLTTAVPFLSVSNLLCCISYNSLSPVHPSVFVAK
jgi:hypothetical protein